MNTPVSIVGIVATDPRLVQTGSSIPLCSFRVASSDRRYDRERQEWVPGETNWFTVSAFRTLAAHAHQSFAKGDRVIVSGRLRVRRWEANEKSGISVEIDADALGHDLRWGVSRFTKRHGSVEDDGPGRGGPEGGSGTEHRGGGADTGADDRPSGAQMSDGTGGGEVHGAELRGAELRGAELRGAELHGGSTEPRDEGPARRGAGPEQRSDGFLPAAV
ncbi:single-stranded DNA-binding protein [Leucobacter sp. CSA1]|uniref:Single-stranded DNA-binding protein n=1 Tax=Leucobacter chromiisoli TaxID=2796471 RepID=A0A934UVG7_9MICO|nr:single-stranded DNA-binding protein [Leucobacter chromiisoli]MBK0419193.1 single-stranded DNA-binding protein [Leucobacter chromiisoli]